MIKKISIIGIGGSMGTWFGNYFNKMGFEVTGYDSEKEIKSK